MSDPHDPESSAAHVPTPAEAAPPALRQAAAGWTARLTWVVMLGLALETLTGLWMLIAPFSVVSQVQVLVHTGAGLLMFGPVVYYQVRHLLAWREQPLSVVKLVGYLAALVLSAALVSGVVVSAQALLDRRVSPGWDQVHLVTGLGTAVLVTIHLVVAYRRRAANLRLLDGFARRLRARWGTVLLGVGAAHAVAMIAATLLPQLEVYRPVPADYTLPEHAQKFDEFRGRPFAPSYARTATGELVNPQVLANSASCGTTGCHEQILAEWEPSAHRFAAMNPPFQAVQKEFAHDRSAADTRYCAGCHDPISLFAGAKDIHNQNLSAPGMQEGASCVVCHTISHVDQRGNADYVLTPPERYLGETGGGLGKRVSDFLIRAYPRQHLADYDRNILRTPEFCGACHKQFIPEALNRFGASAGQNQFDEWRKSHWYNEHSPEGTLSCRDCHMRLVSDSTDPGAGEAGDLRRTADDGAHRHHGAIASNLFMANVLKLPHREEYSRLTEAWLKGETVLPEIADLYPPGPIAPVEILAPAAGAAAAQPFEFQVVVRNRKVGHAFITGPLDFLRVWLHVRVTDADNRLLAEWGAVDPKTREILDEPGVVHESGRRRDSGTLVLEGVPLDEAGNEIVRHELWRKAGGTGQRTIFPRYADKQTFRLTVPEGARGPLQVEASLNFRRYRQDFLDRVVPSMERESGVLQPTITLTSATREIPLGSPTPAAPPL
jgi:hypothetical protein